MKQNRLNVWFIRPGGNDTALVEGISRSRKEKKKINDTIMREFPFIEQVGFIDLKKPELQMAGGEFCGNATRSCVYLYLDGRPGTVWIKTSGTSRMLKAGVDEGGNCWTQIPLPQKILSMVLTEKYTIVPLDGITHVVYPINQRFPSFQAAKQMAKSILTSLNLLKTTPAAGVMFIRSKGDQLAIEPIVWVRDIQTFFYETACGSGTMAVGLWQALSGNKPITDVEVIQPTGETISATVRRSGNSLTEGVIRGKVSIVKKVKLLL